MSLFLLFLLFFVVVVLCDLFLTGGPFVISCGENNNKYLHVGEGESKKQLVGVDDRSSASLFYVFAKESKNIFNIAYYGKKEEERYTGSGMYLTTRTKFGRDEGPLEIGGTEATDFTLKHPSKDDEDVTIEFWKTDGCFVKRNPQRFHCTSYMAFDEAKMSTLCVRSLKNEGRDNKWLRFQLHHIMSETIEQITAFGGPMAMKLGQPRDCGSSPDAPFAAHEFLHVDIEAPGTREDSSLREEEEDKNVTEVDKLI